MPSDNSVTLVGNVTRDPELRFTNTGQANVTFGLAVNRRWQNRQTQEWEEATSFFDVVCWREMAETRVGHLDTLIIEAIAVRALLQTTLRQKCPKLVERGLELAESAQQVDGRRRPPR